MLMQFRLGYDLGLVLSKGILCSLITVFLLMPGLIASFFRPLRRTTHKSHVPDITGWGRFLMKTRFGFVAVFVIILPLAIWCSSRTEYAFNDAGIDELKYSESRAAARKITGTFANDTTIAVLVPSGNYEAEKQFLRDAAELDNVKTVTGLANIEIEDGKVLTDSYTPRMFSMLLNIDFEEAEMLYAAYGVENGQYQPIFGNAETYSVPLIDMFTFLYGEMQDGYVTLDADMAETLESAYSQITNARKQLQSDDYTRMLVYLNLPVGGDETYDFLDQMRVVARKYYPDGEVYVVGDSSSEQDFKTSFSRDNVVVSVLSILIVLVVLLFTFKSAGIPVLLILVIQGSIWINYGIPTITNSPLFFLSYLVVSSIQMGANIDYAIVTTSRFMEFKDKMPKKDAIIETMNMSFPTIITSGLMMAIAGILIGQMTSNAAIAGIGDSLGRGTIITIFIVMFILPQILLLGEKVIDKTAFDMPSAVSSHQSSGRVRIDGMVRGEIHGQISGVVHAVVEGDVNISLLSGTAEPETPPEEPGTPEVPVTAEEEDAEHE